MDLSLGLFSNLDSRMYTYRISGGVVLILLSVLGSLGLAVGQTCDPQQMQQCVEPLKMLTEDKDLSFAATEQELEKVCPELGKAMSCLDQFTSRCVSSIEKQGIDMVYEGARNVISQVCSDTRFRAEYLEHASCMKNAHSGYEPCVEEFTEKSKKAQETTGTQQEQHQAKLQILCCAFHNYFECTTQLFQKRCGDNAANFTKRYLKQMGGSLISSGCSNLSHDSEECSAAITVSSSCFLIVLLVSFTLLFIKK